MSNKKLRFEAGNPVVIELIEAKAPSFCRFGYKVGDKWEVSCWESAEMCGLAYNAFFPFITMFQTGGKAVWKRSEDGDDRVVRTCPDLRPGFRFMIRAKGAKE
jgi:uncharacterized repeat protein (TIGR04076 family)